jgi:hypothetical protein
MKRAQLFRAPRFALFAFCVAALLAVATPLGATETQGDEENGHGDGYAYRIRYPVLDPNSHTLHDAMRTYADVQKKDFLAAQGGVKNTSGAEQQLDIAFNVARRTDEFVSVLANGSSSTGDAHPNPLVASFILHIPDDRLVTVADLFTDATVAVNILATESRQQLEGRFEAQLRDQVGEGAALAPALKTMRDMVESGTTPDAKNFAVFLVDGLDSKAIGLTLVFAPNQVAPYADGAPQVEVPAKLFHALLKPDYVGAFHWDTEAEKAAQH